MRLIADYKNYKNFREGMLLKIESIEFNMDPQIWELEVSEVKTYDDL